MEERLPLYQNGAPAGTLLWREEGLHRVFTADCPGGAEVRKLWLRGPGGGGLLLGTLAPEQGRWRLTRRVARSMLERQGLTGQLWGELVTGEPEPAGPGDAEPPLRARDPVIAAALAAAPRGRWQRAEGGWLLAIPWQVGNPFPLLPLFCFARVGRGEVEFLLGEQGFPAP